MKTNVLVTCIREKYRFTPPSGGTISVEDLWDISRSDLNVIYQGLDKELKELEAPSLMREKPKQVEELDNKIAIVEFIYETKLEEERAAHHQQQEGGRPKNVEIGEVAHDASVSGYAFEPMDPPSIRNTGRLPRKRCGGNRHIRTGRMT